MAVREVVICKKSINVLALVEPELKGHEGTLELHPQEFSDRPKVLEAEFCKDGTLDVVQEGARVASGHTIIDMHHEQALHPLASPVTTEDKEGMISL